jgi:anti-sigma regulatory factor (Ser/Thr protein kinase)
MCSHTSTTLPRPATDIEVKLEPQPQAAGLARRFVARELEALGYVELVDDSRLMVSELVTNSIRYAPGKPVWVDLRRAGKYLVLEVWDCSPKPPVAQDPDFLAEGGRGLHVVEELGVRFGYDLFCCGKVTWVLLG